MIDELAALDVVGVGQKCRHRHLDEIGIAVERLAVGESELGALDLQMDEVRARRIEASRSKPLSSANCCSMTGPWPHGPVLHTV